MKLTRAGVRALLLSTVVLAAAVLAGGCAMRPPTGGDTGATGTPTSSLFSSATDQAGRRTGAGTASVAAAPVGAAAPAGATAAAGGATAAAAASAARSLPPIDARLLERAYAGARSYAGTLSCVGCVDRKLTLTVFADGTFRLREAESLPGAAAAVGTATAAQKASFDSGRWSTAPGGADLLLLHGALSGSRLLRRVAPDGLTVLDHEGREIRGLSGTTLARLPQVDPLPGPMRLAGLYSLPGGRPAFDDCATGRRLVVATEGADPALDAAYLAIRRTPDEPVLAVIDGYFMPNLSGAVHEELRVAAFVQAMRAARCDEILGSRP